MGRRGPPKKPTEQKKLQGIPGGKHKLPQGEPTPKVLENPKQEFPLSIRAKVIFDSLTPMLVRNKLYTEADTVAFHRYANLLDKWLLFDKEIGETLMVDDLKNGGKKPNPALKALDSIGKDLLRLEKEFGMTPAARAALGSVGVSQDENKNDTKETLYG